MSIKQPSAQIAVKNSVLKIYNFNQVFLNNKDEFQIFLFNPLSETVSCQIYLNSDKPLSNKIVLRPEEKIWLETDPSENRKFLFDIYSIDALDADAQKAAQNNGKITVEFYKEQKTNPYVWHPVQQIPCFRHTDFTTTDPYFGTTCGTTTSELSNLSANIANNSTSDTGRIEFGEKSNQNFTYVNKSFEFLPFHTVKLQLLPSSQRALMQQEIRIYCTGCGTRKKSTSWHFCPKCGAKI